MDFPETNLVIHIDWRGPYSFDELESLNGTTDFGLYQIYGTHHVYGSDVLLYIGLASARTFSVRVREHGWRAVTPDPENVCYYVGRLIGEKTPDNDTWEKHINLAERLLIHAHHPAFNTQTGLAGLERDLWYVQVANWGHYRNLLPEVSGARWTQRFDNISYDMHYDTKDIPGGWGSETEEGEQGSAGQPATRPESKPERGDKPQPESEGRSR